MNDYEQMRTTIHEYLLVEHHDLIETTLTCAGWVIDRSISDITGDQSTSDTTHSEGGIPVDEGPADLLREQLRHTGVIERLPVVLTGAVETIGKSLPAEPVVSPPYIVVTNVGPIMRATLDSERLVITIEAFRVDRDTRQYVRTSDAPDEVLVVDIHDHR
jgi:hypothetical protein